MMHADFDVGCLGVQLFPVLRADERELLEFARVNRFLAEQQSIKRSHLTLF
jgi:hypothetical protein